jgi:hypothetical protein
MKKIGKNRALGAIAISRLAHSNLFSLMLYLPNIFKVWLWPKFLIAAA